MQKEGFEKEIQLAKINSLKEIQIKQIEAEIYQYGNLTKTAITLINSRGLDYGYVEDDEGRTIKWGGGRIK